MDKDDKYDTMYSRLMIALQGFLKKEVSDNIGGRRQSNQFSSLLVANNIFFKKEGIEFG